jgi:hypothetical protein
MSARLFSYMSVALLIAIASAVPVAAYAEENSRDFVLINNSDVDVVNLWSSPHNVKTWEEAFANVNVPATTQQEMKFAEPGDYVAGTCLMDMKVEFSDGSTGEWDNVDLCKITKFTVFRDGDGSLQGAVEVAQ